MKKTYSIILLSVLFTTNIFSQINIKETTNDIKKIGEIRIATYWMMDLSYLQTTDNYLYSFKNMEYSSILDVKSWSMNEQSKEELYEFIKGKSFDKSKDVKEFEIDLGGKKILKLKTGYGKVQFWLWNGYNWSYSQWFKMKQINSLYGLNSTENVGAANIYPDDNKLKELKSGYVNFDSGIKLKKGTYVLFKVGDNLLKGVVRFKSSDLDGYYVNKIQCYIVSEDLWTSYKLESADIMSKSILAYRPKEK